MPNNSLVYDYCQVFLSQRRHFFSDNNLMDDQAVPFWEQINQLIKSQKTTQEDLAKSIGIPFGTYRGWNAYKRLPDAVSAYRIARALKTSVEYLVTGEEPDTSKNAILDDLQQFINDRRPAKPKENP